MSDNSRQPKEYDLVLGANNPSPTDGLVLGGIEGVKRRWKSDDIKLKINALEDAISLGNEGIDLVINALKDKSEIIQSKAYLLLRKQSSIRSQNAIKNYNDWLFFRCTKKLTDYYEPHRVNCMVLSSDEKTIISGSMGGWIKMWDLETGKLIHSKYAQSGSITSLAISHNSKLLASGSSELKIKLWNIRKEKITKKQIFKLERGGDITYITFSPDDSIVLFEMPYHGLKLWDWKFNIVLSYKEDEWAKKSCVISLHKRNIVTVKHLINIRNTNLDKLKEGLKSYTGTSSIAINTEQNLIATIDKHNKSNFSINIWDLRVGNIINTLYGHSNYITSLVFSHDSKTLISGSQDQTIKIWDIQTGGLIKTLEGHTSTITSLIITHDGQKIISGGDCSIRIWAIE